MEPDVPITRARYMLYTIGAPPVGFGSRGLVSAHVVVVIHVEWLVSGTLIGGFGIV